MIGIRKSSTSVNRIEVYHLASLYDTQCSTVVYGTGQKGVRISLSAIAWRRKVVDVVFVALCIESSLPGRRALSTYTGLV